jgi:hypothetical protein
MENKEMPKKTFREFLMENISAADYEKLDEFLGESRKMTTQIINDPSRGNMNHLAVIIKLINKWSPDVNEVILIDTYDFGKHELNDAQRELLGN